MLLSKFTFFRFLLPILFLFGVGTVYVFASTIAPAVITGVQAINIMYSGAQITWTTDDPSDSVVLYGITTGSFSNTSSSRCDAGGMVTSHCVNLTGLSSSVTYYYKVRSTNAAGYDAEQTGTFVSAAGTSGGGGGGGSGTTTDIISPTVPNSFSAHAITASQIDLTWSAATDNVGVVGYKIFRNGTFVTGVTGLSYSDTGLSAGTYYSYYVKAADAAGNESSSVYASTTTLPSATPAPAPAPNPTPSPTTASIPAAPTNLQLGGTPTTVSIPLKWNDNSSSEDKWNIERKLTTDTAYSGSFLAQITTANTTTYVDTTVASGVHYDYRVQACLSGAGCSAYAYLSGVSTAASGDTTSPTAPSLYATPYSSTQVKLYLTGATDDVGVVGYKIFRNGTFLASVTTVNYTDTNLSPSTTYSYSVKSFDAALNESSLSSTVTATTPASTPVTTTTATSTPSTTATSSTAIASTSTAGSILVSATVSRGESYCDGSMGKTKVIFSATPSLGAFFRVTVNAYQNDISPGTYVFPNGTYYWQLVARSGYTLSGGTSDSFVLNKTCITTATTSTTQTTAPSTSATSAPKVTTNTTPVAALPTESATKTTTVSIQPVTATATLGSTSSPSQILSIFAQAPAVNTVATPEQYVRYCDDPTHQNECAQYAVKQIATTKVAPVAPSITKEAFTTMESQSVIPGGATNPEELKGICAQSMYASSCADFYVTTNVLTRDEAIRNEKQLLAVRLSEAQVLTERVGVRMFQDSDGDGVTDYDEVNMYHTDPKKGDTNGDGVSDGEHLLLGTDPLLVVSVSAATTSATTTATTQPVKSVTPSRITYEDPHFSGDIKSELLKVTDIKAVPVNTPEQGTTSVKLTLSGRALPNSFVTLFIYSEPIVVTVKADESGAWTYTLDKELPDGTHQVMSALTDGGGHILAKSEPLPFVKEAAAVSIGSSLLVTQPEAPGFFSGASLYALIAVLIGIFTLALVLIGSIVRRRPGEQVSVHNNPENNNNFFP